MATVDFPGPPLLLAIVRTGIAYALIVTSLRNVALMSLRHYVVQQWSLESKTIAEFEQDKRLNAFRIGIKREDLATVRREVVT